MSSRRHWLSLSIVFAALAVSSDNLRAQNAGRFLHEQHTRLFPSCLGCHEGVPTGNRMTSYPEPAVCTRCHNGVDQARVTWSGPSAAITNLRYSHPAHDAKEEIECGACHTPAGANRMEIQRTIAGQCLSCHAHRANEHYTDATCGTCHVPLAATAFSAARVARMPLPADHARNDFLETVHGRLVGREPTRCTTCHTRELCTSCHVNVATLREAARIPSAQPSVGLPPYTARYFEPASHRAADWMRKHAADARDIAKCSACHTRESCLTCHRTPAPRVVARLPRADSVAAPGVSTTMTAPPSHGAPFFTREHGSVAAAAPNGCASCHARSYCESCHSAAKQTATAGNASASTKASPYVHAAQAPVARSPRSDRPVFHLANFVTRHASAAYNRNLECANCHNTTVFCKDCHVQTGMRSSGRLQSGFHDAEPLWLLRHGQAARQGLESCASCHEQRNCTQCHSQTGAFQVNPHGKGFDPSSAYARNPRVCLVCHLTDPMRKR